MAATPQANPILQFLASLTPPPPFVPEEYDGWQFRWRNLVLRPAYFINELYFVLAVLAYAGFFYLGKALNAKKANKWLDAHLPVLATQFSRPTNGGLTADGYSDFFNFSTGRKNVTSLHTVFTLRPRHDLGQYLFQVLWSFVDLKFTPKDEILLDFELSHGPDFVWGVVAKDELANIKDTRWDLTFTKTTDHAALPSSLVVMSEFADITDNMLKPVGQFSLAKVLSDPGILPYFRSLSITDQPSTRPSTGPQPANERSKRLLISLTAPAPEDATFTVPFVTALFKLVDNLDKVGTSLRPETRSKLKKVREEVDKELKVEAEKEQKEEALETKQAAKRKAEEERISRLSASEQKKVIERERKRAMRKSQGKVVRK
ncbi:hypothetical protein JAAARDRAFT_145351 [Jaapia argillacea MUCL 33604]|uniref:DUF1682-domain-containing protein n=1 Tax=Jaapia argillacea MUCL 33604 TaxID=933084 RepID=A0A067QC56_9AGAM|nr:hypothetical protein JAAARDRAFT_145351 [Jaapia argillacea MUCL 33604]